MNVSTFTQWAVFDLRRATWDAVVNVLAASSLMPRVGRFILYRAVGIQTRTPAIGPGIYFQSAKVRIGRRSFINLGAKFFCGHSFIEIGDQVQVAMGVTFVTETHPIGGPEQRCSSEVTSLPIIVGDGCWIGANVTVLPGVRIGHGCVIAAGAVVTRDCAPDGLYAGVPARRVRELV